jgi:RNA binding exosome subunit
MPYKDKQHGMFTYFLLKKLQESKGDVSFKELSDYISAKVSFESVNKNNKEQNPTVKTSDDISDIWGKWKFR